MRATRLTPRLARCCALCLLALLLSTAAGAQEIVKRARPAGERPKIGLVLSGGGAKGLAHIALLKAIDRAGLHIDYLTGTSMGAIIGAMYAAGYSGEQIEQISSEMNWMELINSKPTLRDISIEEKEEFERYTITVPMQGFKFQIGTGVFEPYSVMLKLKEVFYPVWRVNDFGELDIPFKCLAADLGTGEVEVLDHGDLAFATRSSMAMPGVFEATNYKNTKLIDGGVVRNFPVRDVVDMGADYVIGVNLFGGLTPAKDVNTFIDVLLQVTNFRDAYDLGNERRACDLLIEPAVGNYSAASFAAADSILIIGEQTAQTYEPIFRAMADSMHTKWGVPYSPTYRLRAYDPQVRIDRLEFSGLKHTNERLIRRALDLHEGKLYTPQDISDAVRTAMSTGYYANVTYDLAPDSASNGVALLCHVKENPMSALRVALSYNTFTNATIVLDYQIKNLLGLLSKTDFKIAISKNFRALVRNRLLFGIRDNHYMDTQWQMDRFEVPTYDSESDKNLYNYFHNDLSVTLGQALTPSTEWLLRAGWEDWKIYPKVGDKNDLKGHVRNPYIQFQYHVDRRDRKYLAREGALFHFTGRVTGFPKFKLKHNEKTDSLRASGEFDDKWIARLSSQLELRQKLNDHFTLIERGDISVSWGDRAFVHKVALGGCERYLPFHFPFVGLQTARRYESCLALLGVGLQSRIFADLHLTLNANAAVTMQPLDYYVLDHHHSRIEDQIYGGGLTLAYNVLGVFPIDFTLMYSNESQFNVHVNIGYQF